MVEFDSHADGYEAALARGIAVSGEDIEFFAWERVLWLDECLQQQDVTPTRILDYGCGVGTATPFLLRMKGAESVIGVDPSARSLQVARTLHEHLPVQYELLGQYLPNHSIDVAMCNGVFHHIPIDQRQAAARLVADSLRPGGVFALWENNPWSPGARYVMNRIPFDQDAIMVWPSEARRLVESVGLRVIQTDFCFIFPKFLRALRVFEHSLKRFPLDAQYQVLCIKPRESDTLSAKSAPPR